jgi:hypothetical protein
VGVERFANFLASKQKAAELTARDTEAAWESIDADGTLLVTTMPEWRDLLKSGLSATLGVFASFEKQTRDQVAAVNKARKKYINDTKPAKKKPPRKARRKKRAPVKKKKGAAPPRTKGPRTPQQRPSSSPTMTPPSKPPQVPASPSRLSPPTLPTDATTATTPAATTTTTTTRTTTRSNPARQSARRVDYTDPQSPLLEEATEAEEEAESTPDDQLESEEEEAEAEPPAKKRRKRKAAAPPSDSSSSSDTSDQPLMESEFFTIREILTRYKAVPEQTVLIFPGIVNSPVELAVFCVLVTNVEIYDEEEYILGRYLHAKPIDDSTNLLWQKRKGEQVVKIFDTVADGADVWHLGASNMAGVADEWWGDDNTGKYKEWRHSRYMSATEYDVWMRELVRLGWDKVLAEANDAA